MICPTSVIRITMIMIYQLLRADKPFYVGYSKNPKQRFNLHKYKFGTDIEMEILAKTTNGKKKEVEQYWIEKITQQGYILENKNKGGGGPSKNTRTKKSNEAYKEKRKNWSRKGIPQPSTYKKRIQMALKGKPKPAGWGDMMREINLGVPKPKGFGKKVSESQKGIPKEKNRKIILCYTKEGTYIDEYGSINLAAKATNSNPSSVSKVCRGVFGQTNGYQFKFKLEI